MKALAVILVLGILATFGFMLYVQEDVHQINHDIPFVPEDKPAA